MMIRRTTDFPLSGYWLLCILPVCIIIIILNYVKIDNTTLDILLILGFGLVILSMVLYHIFIGKLRKQLELQ